MNDSNKVRKRTAEMATSLISEGYRKTIDVTLPQSCFMKLRHRHNGSIITLVGNYRLSEIKLFRDGRLRHTEPVQ